MMHTRIAGSLLFTSALAGMPGAAAAQEATGAADQRQAQAPAPQNAQPESEGQLADIVVTAQKRSSRVQDTAVAITAVGGADLRSREINSVESLAPSLPNVNFGKNVGFARIAIRGVGLDTTVAGQEGRVAYHLDGVYISRPSAAISTFFDINRVEVVRGPQGTLYGRNATAGAVNVITNDPESTPHGYVKLTGGNYSLFQASGAVTGPLADGLSVRLAADTTQRGGYGHGLVTGQSIDNEHSYAGRAKLRYVKGDFDIVLSGDYFHEKDHNFVYHFMGAGRPNFVPFGQRLGGTVSADPRDTNGDTPQVNFRRFYGFGAVANLDLGFAKLASVTGYRRGYSDYDSDADGTNVNITNFRLQERSHQVSQELRLAGDVSGFKWLIGGYYFDENIFGRVAFRPLRQLSNAPPFAQGVDYEGTVTTRAYAVFGQVDYQILPRLTLSAGARYSYEKKGVDHVGVADTTTPYNLAVPLVFTLFQKDKVDFDSFTPRLGIEYRATRNVLLYFTYSKGFKSGGFSLNAFVAPLEPEKLTDYEGGVKIEWLDGRLRTNFAGFYYDYTNLQVQKILGAVAVPVNAASATVKGIEAEVAARPVGGLELSGNVSLLDAKFNDFATSDAARPELGVIDLTGNRLPQAPKYTYNLIAGYTVHASPGDVTLRGEVAGTGRVFFSPYNRPEVSQGGFVKVNAFLLFKAARGGFDASLFVRNIGNKRTISSTQVSAGFSGYPILGAYDPPRTFGVSVGYSF